MCGTPFLLYGNHADPGYMLGTLFFCSSIKILKVLGLRCICRSIFIYEGAIGVSGFLGVILRWRTHENVVKCFHGIL